MMTVKIEIFQWMVELTNNKVKEQKNIITNVYRLFLWNKLKIKYDLFMARREEY